MKLRFYFHNRIKSWLKNLYEYLVLLLKFSDRDVYKHYQNKLFD